MHWYAAARLAASASMAARKRASAAGKSNAADRGFPSPKTPGCFKPPKPSIRTPLHPFRPSISGTTRIRNVAKPEPFGSGLV
jgi:hypothetical protein